MSGNRTKYWGPECRRSYKTWVHAEQHRLATGHEVIEANGEGLNSERRTS